MKRRHVLAGLAAALLSPGAARADDWKIRLIKSSTAALYGVHVQLAPGWKTYWRVPGEAGIPPAITIAGKELPTAAIDCPLPQRIIDASGEAIGYHDEAVFLLRPAGYAGNLSAFFGICMDVCRPVKFAADLATALPDDALLQKWLERVPRKSDFIVAAKIVDHQLHLELSQPVSDIFVEGPDALYFRKPVFDGTSARLKIDGGADEGIFKNLGLRLTAAADGSGIEQTITIS